MANEYTISAKFDNTQIRQGVRQISDIIRDAGRTANEVQSNMGVSANSLKRDLRQLKGLLSTLTYQWRNLSDVERSSELGLTLQAQIQAVEDKAGELADIQGDVSRVIGDIASDTRIWDAASEGLGILSNVGQTAVSVWGMFGGSVEDCARAINAFNAVEATFNTIIAIGNAVQKESAIMRGINTVQQWALTRATQAGTVAQEALNVVANANPYMLLATALAAVGTAIWTYISLTDDETEATKKSNEELDRKRNAAVEYSNEFNKSMGKTMTSYKKLEVEYQSLTTVHAKLDWIKKNQDAFHDLKLEINSLADAEKAFKTHTKDVVKSFAARALAAAATAQATKLYQDALNVRKYQRISKKEAKKLGLVEWKDYVPHDNTDTVMLTSSGAAKTGMGRASKNDRLIENLLKMAFKQEAYADSLLDGLGIGYDKSSSSSSNNGRGGHGGGNGDDDQPTGLIEKQEAKIRDLEEQKKKATSTEQIAKLNNEIYKARYMLDELQNTVLTPTIKFKVDDLTTSKSKDNPLNIQNYGNTPLFDFTNEIKEGIDNSFKKEQISKELQKMLDDIAKGADTDKLEDKFKWLSDEYEKLGGNVFDPKSFDDAIGKWAELKDAIDGLFGSNVFDEQMEKFNRFIDLLKSHANWSVKAGASIAYLGQTFEALGAKGDLAKTAAVMAAVGQIILGFAEASEKAAKKEGPVGWLLFLGTGIAAAATIISTIKGFSSGGIVGEGNTIGDNTLIRVNKNEMVLNTRQQAHLFDILNGGNNNTMNGRGGEVTFKIRGCDLYGSLSNYSKIKAKSGKLTGLK